MKKMLLSIPFIILIALDMLFMVGYSERIFGAFGVLEFPNTNPATELFGLLCFPILPALAVTYFYARAAARNQVNVIALVSWTLLVFGAVLILIYLPDPRLEAILAEQFFPGRRWIAIMFASLGALGVVFPRIRRALQRS